MTATHNKIDWNGVRERLERTRIQDGESGSADRVRLNEVLRQRAQRLARRGREEAAQARQVPSIVFRFGNERFGVELAQVKQILPLVPITPIPGTCNLLLGVANLNGVLRSIVDLRLLVHLPATQALGGHIVLLQTNGKSLGVWVETLEGVCQVDLDRLAAVDEAAAGSTGKLIRGTTDDHILVLDANALIEHVTEQRRQHASNQ